jgi:predicted membrane protein
VRIVSLLIAGVASLIGLVFPFLLARQATGLNQSILMVMMCGVAGAFVYGAGFKPLNRGLRLCTEPAVTWPVMLISLGALVALR